MNNDNQWVTLEGSEGPGKGRHILFISGDEEYRSEESLPMLAQIMAKHHGFKCTVLFAINPQNGCVDPEVLNNIPGMHQVDEADMIVMLIRFRQLPDKDMKRFIDYTFSGKPILALRTATHAFKYEGEDSPYAKYTFNNKEYDGGFGRQILGETWVSHHGHHAYESTRAVPRADMKNHPILQGVDTMWGPSDVYEAHPPKDAEVLVDGHVLTGMDPDDPLKPDTPTMPVAWIRQPGKPEGTGRVFCTTMGAAVDLKDQAMHRLVINGIYWCMGMEKEISQERSVDPVGEYDPSYYGYGDFQKGKKPQDFFK
jgi:type 1 glutamine amidotransferase